MLVLKTCQCKIINPQYFGTNITSLQVVINNYQQTGLIMLKLNEKFFIIKKTRIEAINDQKQFIHSFSIQNILNIYNIPDMLWAEYIVVKKICMIPNLT